MLCYIISPLTSSKISSGLFSWIYRWSWEAKLGCVFTQTKWDEEGYAIRDPDSTTYVGAIETAEEFRKRIYLEAWKRGWSRAEKKIVMGDGAEWIWNIADPYFPGAVQIVDLYHARQHLWELA